MKLGDNDIFTTLKENNYQPRILYPENIQAK